MKVLKLAHLLGWASLGIAAAEILGQGYVERELLGIDEHPQLMPSLGFREAAAGIIILSQSGITRTLAAGLWSRVAGDAIDVALLSAAAPTTRKPIGFTVNVLTVLGITALDIGCAVGVGRKLREKRAPKPARNLRLPRSRVAMQRMTAGL